MIMISREHAERTAAKSSAVTARCAAGRFLGPAERAAVIRKLAMESLGIAVAIEVADDELRLLHARVRMKQRELETARVYDAALRAIGQ